MKKKIVIEYDPETKKATIITEKTTIASDGFAILSGNQDNAYMYLWGYYDPIIGAFYAASQDPNYADFFAALRRKRQEITPEEAIEKFEACQCVGACQCTKTFH